MLEYLSGDCTPLLKVRTGVTEETGTTRAETMGLPQAQRKWG
jgi:hypothetical protein